MDLKRPVGTWGYGSAELLTNMILNLNDNLVCPTPERFRDFELSMISYEIKD
jgi:hypothetical protein